MKSVLKAVSITFIVVLSFVPCPSAFVLAQSSPKENPEEQQKKRQELERKTLLMLDEMVAASSSLKLPENRTFILSSAANLVWPYDQKRARNLFWEAINNLNPVPSAKTSTSESPANNAYFQTYARRSEILNLAAKRDAQLALELLQASRQAPPESGETNWLATEQGLEQEIASAAAATDPKKALQLAREGLSRGPSLQLLSLLSNLNQKDPELGTKFASEVIDKLAIGSINNNLNAYIAVSLLSSSRKITENTKSSARLVSASVGPASYKNLELPKEQRRALTEMLVNAASSASVGPTVLSIIGGVMPEIEEFFPERALMLKRKRSENELSQRQRNQDKYNSIVSNGTAEEILKASLKGNDEERLWLEHEAILNAVYSKKTDSFRDFIAKEVTDESRRKSLIDFLDAKEIDLAAYRGDTEAMRKLLPKIRLREQRARTMAELAMLLETKGKHDEALTLLDEAQALVKTDLQSESKSNALLTLMLAYALIEPPKAFVLAERTIDKANDDVSKLLLFDKLIKSGFLKKGEILLDNSGMISSEFALLKYGKGVTALAHADFGRTRAAADRFERHELRILARLLIAQAILNSEQYTASRLTGSIQR